MDWIEDGDRNTSFFHSIIGTRAHYNIISQVTDHQGNIHSDHAGIRTRFSITIRISGRLIPPLIFHVRRLSVYSLAIFPLSPILKRSVWSVRWLWRRSIVPFLISPLVSLRVSMSLTLNFFVILADYWESSFSSHSVLLRLLYYAILLGENFYYSHP